MAKEITFSKAHGVLGQVLESLTDKAWYTGAIRESEIKLQGHSSPELILRIVLAYDVKAEVSSHGYVEFYFEYDGIQVNITLT